MKLFVLISSVLLVLGTLPRSSLQVTYRGYEGHPFDKAESSQIQPLAISGAEAIPHQFPYQVGIISHQITGINGFCGGSLLSANYVLTAAHCLAT